MGDDVTCSKCNGVVTVISVQLIVYIQLVSDKALLGRIMSLVMIVTTLAVPLGQVMYGGFAAMASGEMLLLLIIVTSLVTVVIAFFSIKIFKQMGIKKNIRINHTLYKKSNPIILIFFKIYINKINK